MIMETLEHVRKSLWAVTVGLGFALTACAPQHTDGSMEAPTENDTNPSRTEGTVEETGTDADRTMEVERVEPTDRGELEARWGATAEDRRAVLDELDDLEDRINDQINEVDRHMRRTEDESRLNSMREYRLELERERARVTDAIRNVEVSEEDTYTSIGEAARNTAKDVGDWFDRQGDRIEALFTDEEEDMNEEE